MPSRRSILSLAILSVLSRTALAASHEHPIEEVIITGVYTDAPLLVTTNPKAPRQPLPAHDGADYLKTIPGFSSIRKGGTDGDPVFRGMAGSRLSLLVDGEMILGGCSARMDPPTAYVFPETFDRIQVIKGPQSVRHGPGNSAGVVLFERDRQRPETSGWKVHSSALGGNFGRHDEVLDATLETPEYAVRLSATNASQDDYEDGDGNTVHSQYQRWNSGLSLALTPDEHTRIELSATISDGEAAYADRAVDGSKFARDNYGLKFSRHFDGPLLQALDAQVYYNHVDHVMDNYSLRTPDGAMAAASAMNPDRQTTGSRFSVELAPAFASELVLGFDTQRNEHANRISMNQTMVDYATLERIADAAFTQGGIFAEIAWDLDDEQRLLAGARVDRWRVQDRRELVSVSMMTSLPNPSMGLARKELLQSGFVRYERDLAAAGATVYAGIGHNERFPDYWELIARESATSVSAFDIASEKNTQLDTGVVYRQGKLSGSVSAFYNRIDDFLLVQNGVRKPLPAMGGMGTVATREASIVRNVAARSWGLELDAQYAFSATWRSEMTLASVRGANDTDNTTLPQLSPLEARFGIYYDNQVLSAGVLWRALASQDRVDPGKGNIAGQDIGVTPASNIFSVNAGWRPQETVLVSAGIDNLFDRTYAEHISRAGAMIPGFTQTTRVNEPGRTLWLKAQLTF
jgi:iron complex outermembrane receptor protein